MSGSYITSSKSDNFRIQKAYRAIITKPIKSWKVLRINPLQNIASKPIILLTKFDNFAMGS